MSIIKISDYNSSDDSDSCNIWTIGENGNWYCNGIDSGKKATGVGSNCILSVTPPSEPYDGLIWCKVESAADEAYINVNNLTVIESSSQPVNPKNGTIWIKS